MIDSNILINKILELTSKGMSIGFVHNQLASEGEYTRDEIVNCYCRYVIKRTNELKLMLETKGE